MPAEERMGGAEDEKTKAESTSIRLEEKMEEGEDKKEKANDITKDSGGSSKSYGTNLEIIIDKKGWYKVNLLGVLDRDEQEAVLLELLKCDKSELPSMFRYRSMTLFEAYLTVDEARKLRGFKQVTYIMFFYPRNESKPPKQTKYAVFKPRKKQRLNSDLNVGDSEEEESEDDYDSDDGASSCRCECYMPFNESGRRWYKVHLENDKSSDEQVALLVDVLKRGRSEFLYIHHAEDLFEAFLTEEEAEKVAGVEDVEYAEPRRYVWQLE